MPKKITKTVKTPTRPPIVTIMGHVDHGKTTLLDTIRKTNVAAREEGKITQHIGAYQVEVEGTEGKKKITFIDTPGHEAFIKMRSRGAAITDIVVLVVAANDGVMPQTIEAIGHIKQAKVPAIVAINKIDLPDAQVEKVKKQLAKNDLLLEGYGGDVVAVEISAKTGKGIQELLEMIILTAEMAEIKANPFGELKLAVIESKLDKNRGPVATVIILNGKLRVREMIELGGVTSKVRALIDTNGKSVEEADLGTPVEVVGLEKVPEVGEATGKIQTEKSESFENQLKIVLKTDVVGSLEAIKYSLPSGVNIISSQTGAITESDILLAKASKAIIIGFNVKLPPQTEALAKTEKVRVKIYSIIYELLDEIEEAVEMVKNPASFEEIVGKAKIVTKFVTSFGEIAGCKVTEGRIARTDKVKLLRQDQEIGLTRVKTIHRLKEDIPKAEIGTECGILLHPTLDFQTGDMIVSVRENA